MNALAPRTPYRRALSAVYEGQLARARVARVPLLFVACLQSIGLLVLLRGVVDDARVSEKQQIVSGAVVLVIAFVALNLLAQRLGHLRANGGLAYYAALGTPPSAVVLGTAASYATFALPGTVVTAVTGALLYDLPLAGLWVLLPVAVLGGAALAGVGAALGLLAPKPEVATVLGQLGMTLVLFLGLVRPARMPVPLRPLLAAVPSTYAVNALREAFATHPRYGVLAANLAVCAAVGVVALALAGAAFRRAVGR
ncbi:MAG: type transport system permease protein [Frankiaceae bacterium]|nr:type transport system permease protein [Frankiaceae bacterium]